MSYAEIAEIKAVYAETDLIQVTDDAGAGEIDDTILAAVRDQADNEINGYVSTRYGLPLAETPPLLKNLSVRLTWQLLLRRRRQEDENARKEYDEICRVLRSIAEGRIALGVTPDPPASAGKVGEVSDGDRDFTKTKMSGF